MSNVLKSGFLMALMTALLIWVGNLVGGQGGMIIAFGIALLMNVFSYWFSDKIVLRMYRARPVSEQEAPELVAMVRELAANAALPMPRVFVIPDDSPNAFATGRNPRHAVVAVTRGLMNILDRHELKGVLAHEMAHVEHRDILIGSIAAVLAGAIMLLASMARWGAIMGGLQRDDNGGGGLGLLVAAIVAPLAAMMIQMAISRSREFMADARGAKLSGNPMFLASALRKLERFNQSRGIRGASPQTAHMFIVNPLRGRAFQRLFSTHPTTAQRLERLENMQLG